MVDHKTHASQEMVDNLIGLDKTQAERISSKPRRTAVIYDYLRSRDSRTSSEKSPPIPRPRPRAQRRVACVLGPIPAELPAPVADSKPRHQVYDMVQNVQRGNTSAMYHVFNIYWSIMRAACTGNDKQQIEALVRAKTSQMVRHWSTSFFFFFFLRRLVIINLLLIFSSMLQI